MLLERLFAGSLSAFRSFKILKISNINYQKSTNYPLSTSNSHLLTYGRYKGYHAKALDSKSISHTGTFFRFMVFQVPTIKFQLPNSNYHVPTIKFKLSSFNYQVPTIMFQLSSFNCQLSSFNYHVSTIDFQLSNSNYQVKTIKFQL